MAALERPTEDELAALQVRPQGKAGFLVPKQCLSDLKHCFFSPHCCRQRTASAGLVATHAYASCFVG